MTEWQMPAAETLLRAFEALGKLLANEYPDGYSLTAIADTWGVTDPFIGDFSDEDVDAIRAVEGYLDAMPEAEPATGCLRVRAVAELIPQHQPPVSVGRFPSWTPWPRRLWPGEPVVGAAAGTRPVVTSVMLIDGRERAYKRAVAREFAVHGSRQ